MSTWPDDELAPDQVGICLCGMSPTGKCLGWHSMSPEEAAQALEQYRAEEQVKRDLMNQQKQ